MTASRLPLLFGALGLAAQARAGVILEGQNDFKGHPSQNTIFLQGGKIRMERHDPTDPAKTVVTLFDGDRLIHLDPTTKTYTAFTLAQLDAQMAKLEQMKAALPPELRAKLEAATGSPSPMEFVRAGGTTKVAGISCDTYKITGGYLANGTACLGRWSAATVQTEDLAALHKMLSSMKSLARLLPLGDLQLDGANKWPGWPLILTDASGAEIHRTTKLTRTEISPAQFEVPAGYTEKSLPSLAGNPALIAP